LLTLSAPNPLPQVPLLVRGLRQDNTTAIKRKACLIVENMAKLVDNPLDAVPFLPKLLPGERRLLCGEERGEGKHIETCEWSLQGSVQGALGHSASQQPRISGQPYRMLQQTSGMRSKVSRIRTGTCWHPRSVPTPVFKPPPPLPSPPP
jgi:hypothetical protein